MPWAGPTSSGRPSVRTRSTGPGSRSAPTSCPPSPSSSPRTTWWTSCSTTQSGPGGRVAARRWTVTGGPWPVARQRRTPVGPPRYARAMVCQGSTGPTCDLFAPTLRPSPLRGRVGVGGTTPRTTNPHRLPPTGALPPAPSTAGPSAPPRSASSTPAWAAVTSWSLRSRFWPGCGWRRKGSRRPRPSPPCCATTCTGWRSTSGAPRSRRSMSLCQPGVSAATRRCRRCIWPARGSPPQIPERDWLALAGDDDRL